jgi:hypothetical protein
MKISAFITLLREALLAIGGMAAASELGLEPIVCPVETTKR